MFGFFLVMIIIIPATMIFFGMWWKKRPPKTINQVYGYRTVRSMKSQQTWNFAHRSIGIIWLYSGIPLGLLSILMLIMFKEGDKDTLGGITLVITGIQLIGLCFPIIPVEIALKKKFDENGNRK